MGFNPPSILESASSLQRQYVTTRKDTGQLEVDIDLESIVRVFIARFDSNFNLCSQLVFTAAACTALCARKVVTHGTVSANKIEESIA